MGCALPPARTLTFELGRNILIMVLYSQLALLPPATFEHDVVMQRAERRFLQKPCAVKVTLHEQRGLTMHFRDFFVPAWLSWASGCL